MRRFSLGLFLLASLVSALPLYAIRTGGPTVVIPVIGRFPGAGGSQWRTDVFLSNPYSPSQSVTLKFYPTGGALMTHTVSVPQFGTATFPDIVLNTFGLTTSAGVLEVSGDSIQARARIFNSGNPAGEFAQGVPGIEKTLLNRQALLFGLTGNAGTRVNVGVCNPNDVALTINFRISDASNVTLYSVPVTVQPHSYVQFSDIFNTYAIPPQTGVVVQFNGIANDPIYGYASEVRNDTGDAIFSFGTSPNS